MRLLLSKDVLAGLVFMAVAAVFGLHGERLDLGTARNLGAGAFPTLVSGLLGFMGLVVFVNGMRTTRGLAIHVGWRAGAAVPAAVLAFACAVVPLGFAPAIALASFISSLASVRFNFVPALLQAAIVTAFCCAVFLGALGLPFQILGPWLGGH